MSNCIKNYCNKIHSYICNSVKMSTYLFQTKKVRTSGTVQQASEQYMHVLTQRYSPIVCLSNQGYENERATGHPSMTCVVTNDSCSGIKFRVCHQRIYFQDLVKMFESDF